MRKASKFAKGGVVLGLSAATFIAYGGSAIALTTPQATAISVSPPSTGTTTNTNFCTGNYTANVTPSTATGTVDVTISQPANPATAGTEDLCGGTFVTSTANSITYSFTVSNGQISFSATDTSPETDTIQVFDDHNNSGAFDNGEANALTSATFVNNRTNSAVKSLSVQATNVKARPGDNVHFVVTALNGNSAVPVADQGVGGATVNFVVTGPDAQGPTPCSGNPTSNSDGTVYCPVRLTGAATASGTDTVTFFVNNATNSGPGVDAGDSQTTATVNNIGAAPAGDTVTAFCDANTNNSGRSCTDPIDTTNPNVNNTVQEDFEFDILDPATNPAFICCGSNPSSHTGDTGADTTIDYTLSGASSGATLSTTSNDCTTDGFVENGEGACDTYVNVTEPNPTVGEVITVTGTIHGTTINSNATVTLTAAAETARHITLTPASQNVVTNHTGVLTATVTDAGGHPVPGIVVDFSSTGQGAFTTGCILSATCVAETSNFPGSGVQGGPPETNAKGQIQVQVSSNTTGNQAVSATIDPGQPDPNDPTDPNDDFATQCGDPSGFVNGEPVAGIAAGNCTATAAVKYIAAPVVHFISERPHLSGHVKGHSIHLTATTHPTLRHKSVHFYRVRNGILHLIGAAGTGSTGKAHLTLRGLKSGHYNIVCRVVHAGAHVHSHRSNHKHFTI